MLKFGSSSMASKIAGSISKTRSLRERPKSCVEGLNVPWALSLWKMFVNVRALGITRLENISMYCDERGIYTFYFIPIAENIHLQFNKSRFVLTTSKLFLCNL
jgi:hypothetical protein